MATRKRSGAGGGLPVRMLVIATLAAVFVLAAVMLVNGALHRDALRGSWMMEDGTVYEFDGKGSGMLRLPLSDLVFRYTAKDGVLRIDFTDEDATDAGYRYTRAGDTLRLESNTGTVFRLEKQP